MKAYCTEVGFGRHGIGCRGALRRLHNALKSSGTSPNFLITLASLKSPVAP
jgi:hypothetical protein